MKMLIILSLPAHSLASIRFCRHVIQHTIRIRDSRKRKDQIPYPNLRSAYDVTSLNPPEQAAAKCCRCGGRGHLLQQ
jgi:hypothetical protein